MSVPIALPPDELMEEERKKAERFSRFAQTLAKAKYWENILKGMGIWPPAGQPGSSAAPIGHYYNPIEAVKNAILEARAVKLMEDILKQEGVIPSGGGDQAAGGSPVVASLLKQLIESGVDPNKAAEFLNNLPPDVLVKLAVLSGNRDAMLPILLGLKQEGMSVKDMLGFAMSYLDQVVQASEKLRPQQQPPDVSRIADAFKYALDRIIELQSSHAGRGEDVKELRDKLEELSRKLEERRRREEVERLMEVIDKYTSEMNKTISAIGEAIGKLQERLDKLESREAASTLSAGKESSPEEVVESAFKVIRKVQEEAKKLAQLSREAEKMFAPAERVKQVQQPPPQPRKPSPLEEALADLLREWGRELSPKELGKMAADFIKKKVSSMRSGSGVGDVERIVLDHIRERGVLDLEELKGRYGIEPSRAVEALRRLEERGVVRVREGASGEAAGGVPEGSGGGAEQGGPGAAGEAEAAAG